MLGPQATEMGLYTGKSLKLPKKEKEKKKTYNPHPLYMNLQLENKSRQIYKIKQSLPSVI